MSDLIDRQAAIDALNEVVKDHSITDFDAIASILDLPPAQPEPHYDEWCTNCKEYDHENHCCPRWTKVIRQTMRELQDEFVMTAVDGTLWVTVDDVQKVGRVIVDEEKSKFCRQFYMDAQPEPCEDAVSREAVLDALRTCYDTETITYDNGDEYIHYGDAVGEVEHLPPVTPKQRTGHWIPVGMVEVVGGESAQWGSAVAYHKCSECDEQALRDDFEQEVLSKWCPHCGVKMVGVSE